MTRNTEKTRLFSRRAVLLGGVKTGVFSLLVGRLYYLQVIGGANYRQMAEENRISVRIIIPPRGKIMDRYGAPLAMNEQTFRVVLLPERATDLNTTLDTLNQFIPIEESDRKRIERELREQSGYNAIIIKENLSRDQMDAIAVRTPELIGVDIDAGEVRTYPYAETTSHILGYVGAVSRSDTEKAKKEESKLLNTPGLRIGKNGIERQYETKMRGIAGNVEMEVNARGRVVRELVRHDPQSGEDLTLSIDIGLQQFTQQKLAKHEGASAVVVDVNTGEVLVLASHPGFDPNLFTYGISKKDWDSLNNDIHAPLLNKAISGVYAPGSTFKPITALAALESGLIDPRARVFCPGHYELGSHKFHCWKRGGHGPMNLVEAMAASCDTYFYDISRRIGIDRIQAMSLRFGLGKKLDIDLPHERPGFVPSRAWKKTNRKQDWQQGETLISAIGQGFLLTSPLQLAIMTARIANNGFAVKPHIVNKIGEQTVEFKKWPSMGLNPKHLDLVRQSLFSVVNDTIGTAFSARIAETGFEMSGKTGSAQVRRISESERKTGVFKNEDLPWKERDHALFIGYAPAAAPKYAVAVVVEHGGSGSQQAAPIARDILKECQSRHAKKPTE